MLREYTEVHSENLLLLSNYKSLLVLKMNVALSAQGLIRKIRYCPVIKVYQYSLCYLVRHNENMPRDESRIKDTDY